MAVDGLDTNHDGIYDKGELAALTQANIDGLKEYNYFTVAAIGSENVLFSQPTDAWLEYQNSMLTLHFTLPLAMPVKLSKAAFLFSYADPSGFIAFEPEDAPLALKSAPATCKGVTPAMTRPLRFRTSPRLLLRRRKKADIAS